MEAEPDPQPVADRSSYQGDYRTFYMLAENSSDFIGMCDLDGFAFYGNAAALHATGLHTFERMLGTNLRDYFFPEDRQFVFDEFFPQVLRDGTATVEIRFRRFDTGEPVWMRWCVFSLKDADGDPIGFGTISRDITEARYVTGALRESEGQLRDTQRRLQAALSAGEIATWTLDVESRRVSADANLARLHGVSPDRAADAPLEAYLETIQGEDRPLVIDAIDQAIRIGDHYEAEYRVTLADGSARWLVARGRIERDAAGGAVSLPGVVVDVTARKSLEQERERLLDEQRIRAEREALVNGINVAIRAPFSPVEVQERAVALLGEALDADRCYFAAYDLTREFITVERDYRRAGLPSLAGRYSLGEFDGLLNEIFSSEGTVVCDDVRMTLSPDHAAVMEEFGLRSMIAVPFYESGQRVAALFASMSGVPRAWNPDDTSLVEAVATQTRTALEAARIALRERNIAQQLQQALQPDLPGRIPGLAVTKYYEAALTEEANVGGDFFDVFAVEKGCTALVVGDLSGKGLTAAAQVSIVRNMLRAFLYSKRTLVDAVTELNRILVENHLLAGFSTLFVSVYDVNERVLKYVNCGQEPALVRRAATGEVTPLMPTGLILGTIENTVFSEKSVTLVSGDALAIFSDGLTEVGPSRKEMLGLDGVADLFRKPLAREKNLSAVQLAEKLTRRLIDDVNAAARGGVTRDDVCLLITVIE